MSNYIEIVPRYDAQTPDGQVYAVVLLLGFRFSVFAIWIPRLRTHAGVVGPVHVSCVETCTQFAFHRTCTARHARVGKRKNHSANKLAKIPPRAGIY